MTRTAFPYHYPCLHDSKGVPISCDCDDYHPLTVEDAELLLGYALSRYWHEANSIQVRFGQAIRGMRCPHPGGEIGDKLAKMDERFVAYVKSGGDESIKKEILALIN